MAFHTGIPAWAQDLELQRRTQGPLLSYRQTFFCRTHTLSLLKWDWFDFLDDLWIPQTIPGESVSDYEEHQESRILLTWTPFAAINNVCEFPFFSRNGACAFTHLMNHFLHIELQIFETDWSTKTNRWALLSSTALYQSIITNNHVSSYCGYFSDTYPSDEGSLHRSTADTIQTTNEQENRMTLVA